MARVYITALFAGAAAAIDAKRALSGVKNLSIERTFVVHRDERGFHVDGRYAAEPPHGWIELLSAALARVFTGTSREEDSVAVSDAEEELGVGQAALIVLLDEAVPNVADPIIRSFGGVLIRALPKTIDAEDTERFFAASTIPGFTPKTPL